MARPRKKGLAFYPFELGLWRHPAIRDLKDMYGPKGMLILFAAWTCIYENGYYLATTADTLARDVQEMVGSKWVKRDLTKQVILYLAELDLLDNKLLCEGIFTSRGIQARYAKATVRCQGSITDFRLIDGEEDGENAASSEKNDRHGAEGSAAEEGVNVTETQVNVTETTTKEERRNIEDSSSLAHVRARESKLDLLKLSDGEAEQLVRNLPKAKLDHYCDVILRCEAEGKRFRKQTHFEAIRAMAIADGVWGTRPAPKKTASCKPQSFDPEAAWQKAIERTYGGG